MIAFAKHKSNRDYQRELQRRAHAHPKVLEDFTNSINIFENAKGQTVVSYIKPSILLAGFNNPELDKMAGMLDEKLGGMEGMIGK